MSLEVQFKRIYGKKPKVEELNQFRGWYERREKEKRFWGTLASIQDPLKNNEKRGIMQNDNP